MEILIALIVLLLCVLTYWIKFIADCHFRFCNDVFEYWRLQEKHFKELFEYIESVANKGGK